MVSDTGQIQTLTDRIKSDIKENVEHFSEIPVKILRLMSEIKNRVTQEFYKTKDRRFRLCQMKIKIQINSLILLKNINGELLVLSQC